MKNNLLIIFLFCVILCFVQPVTFSQDFYSSLSQEDKELYDEHLRFGQPDDEELLIRNAYISHYNAQCRFPDWVAYHVLPDYLNTPQRKGKFSRFRTDNEVDDPVKDDEYVGLFAKKGYARGHLAPYKILGGDRDGDGIYAEFSTGANSDSDDEQTIFQGNYLTNIAPQHHYAINGPGGLWYKLERWIQDDVVAENEKEIWIYAGCVVFDTENIEGVGKNNSIVVPNLFYKIVIMESEDESQTFALAFLFPHYKNKVDLNESDIFRYLVPIDYIEAITGLNFLSELSESDQIDIESSVNINPWEDYID